MICGVFESKMNVFAFDKTKLRKAK